MKKVLALLTLIVTLTSCSKDETNDNPSGFTVSQGTVVGAIRISFTKDPDVSSVMVERRDAGGPWVGITGTAGSFDDVHNYPSGMPPGKIFEYRLRNDYPDDAPYVGPLSGYAYPIKQIDEINITSNPNSNLLTWNAGNIVSFQNEAEIIFKVMRSTDSLSNFKELNTVGEDRSYFDDFSNNPDLQGIPLYYRVDVYYSFHLLSPYGSGGFMMTEPLEGTVIPSF